MGARLKVVLCWHMHQPWYRDPISGHYELPWTYLHAIKDYVDMAAHLEAVPGASSVVNFTPILLEQIVDYERQVVSFLHEGTPLRDPFLDALATARLPQSAAARLMLVKNCLRAHEERLIRRYAPYAE